MPDYPVVDGRRNNFEAREKPNLMDAVNGNATENVTASKDVTLESSTSMRELLNNGEMKMEIKGKVHLFFEQSGTFKNEFIKLGIPAEDYDIQNNFGQTDHIVDLFDHIEREYDKTRQDKTRQDKTIFDDMTKDDLIMAFFPCIKFCNIAEYNQRSAQEKWRRDGMPVERIYEQLKKQSDDRYFFYQKCLKMHAVVEIKGLRMIMENPWHETNYTNYFWFMKPSVIDMDRSRRGDRFVKPTAYWFTGCTPTNGETLQPTPKNKMGHIGMTSAWRNGYTDAAKGSSKTGLCSEERSMISPDYARNFICDFILGKKQDIGQLSLF